jgi:hypothetical protein
MCLRARAHGSRGWMSTCRPRSRGGSFVWASASGGGVCLRRGRPCQGGHLGRDGRGGHLGRLGRLGRGGRRARTAGCVSMACGRTCVQAHSRRSSSLHLSGRRLATLVSSPKASPRALIVRCRAGHCKPVSPCTAHRLTSGITVAVHVGQLEARTKAAVWPRESMGGSGSAWGLWQRGQSKSRRRGAQRLGARGRGRGRFGRDAAAVAAVAAAGVAAGLGRARKQKFPLAPAKPASSDGATATATRLDSILVSIGR